MSHLLELFVHWTAGFGLNYNFLLDAYQRGTLEQGALTTALLCLFTIVGSLLAGVGLAAMLTSGKPWLAKPARVFIEVTRNTPTLVQLYCAFLVLNMLLTQAVGTANPLTPFAWVVIVISLHKGAFHAEALRAGIEAVPAVTLEAASSLAFSSRQLLWNVQLPLALRFALPSLINNLIDLVKMTAVASAIAVGDITYAWTSGRVAACDVPLQPPQCTSREFTELLAGHHTLLAHGKSVQAIRAAAKQPPIIGYAPVAMSKMPVDPSSAADIAAARQHMFSVATETAWTNTWWMDPVFLGHYPEDGLKFFGNDAPTPHPGDLETMAQPLDFCGVNIYQGQYVRASDNGPEEVPMPVGARLTAFEWYVTPDAMYWGPKFLHERYGKPIVITENGISCRDWVSKDGAVHDAQRIDFTHRHLDEAARAIADGVPIQTYFHWSFIDNFEWGHGYKHRFGMIFCDYENGGARTIKDSGRWYAEVIKTNGASLG